MIEGEVAALLQGPCSLIVGTVDVNGLPAAARAFGLELLDGGARVRLIMATTATPTIANLESTGVIAVTGTDVATFFSVQIKGRGVIGESCTDAERARSDDYLDGFFAAIQEADGTPVELLEVLRPAERFTLEMTVDELFDQTPGPTAGRSLSSTGA
jgi:hypothetical protein